MSFSYVSYCRYCDREHTTIKCDTPGCPGNPATRKPKR